ncbi:winged helix DNA-binding domain-containing protein [Levilactobacillus fuyuanensis]|uniref:Winged helix DNA-binding domain-containing protein n=1 Tax=Levilactobacillus fuyuanensis TaxID=2486022 RepID=A0ABW4H5S2_9LACO|nr:winged helix DNA-binding domain-containing protein [Levilactobacillus fuyuanensis]
MNQAELLAYRLYQQGLLTTSAELAASFFNIVGIQAQNQRAAELNVALQTGITRPQLLKFYQEQGIVRSWAQRWTIHLMTSDDLRLVVSARQNERLPKAYFLGVEEHVRAAVTAIDQLLQQAGRLTRAAYTAHLQAAFTWYAERPHNFDYAVLQVLTAQGKLQMAPTTSGQDWLLLAPATPTLLNQQVATTELIRRYLQGFGPATMADFVKWSGIKVSQVKPAWQTVLPELTPVTVGQEKFWTIAPISSGQLTAITDQLAHLTVVAAGFSSPMTGYRDKSWLVPEPIRQQLWSKNGILRAPIIANGVVVGKWTTQISQRQIAFAVESWGPFDQNQLEEGFDRVARFLELDYAGFTEKV